MSSNAFNQSAAPQYESGKEPEMDLSAFYQSPDDPRIEQDLKTLQDAFAKFAQDYKGRVASLSGAELFDCLAFYDRQKALASVVGSYASLLSAKNLEKYSPFNQRISQRLSDLGEETIFLGLELSKIPQADLTAKIAQEPRLALYRIYLEKKVQLQPHMLGEEAEIVASKKSMTGQQAWSDFFDEIDTRIKFKYKGKLLTIEEIGKLRQSPDRAVRKAATKALYKGLKGSLWMRAYVSNTLSQDSALDDDLRRVTNPVQGMNMYNNISNNVVDTMNGAINRAYPRVSHRYYECLRSILGLTKLKGYDRNAPIHTGQEQKIPYDAAKQIVLTAYHDFSPEMADIARQFFDKNWIDAPATPGKRSGAFSASTSIDKHPVVFLNYKETPRDVATMAHELGHGVHQYKAAQALKSQIASSTPLTIAETASVFGERLVFEKLLSAEKDPQRRVTLLAGKINDMINTVVRQNAFFNFEKEFHAARKARGANLKEEEINAIYLRTQKAALGPAFDLDEAYGIEWSYIPHFIHKPYYVYSYAFGDCLVNSLYRKYEEATDKAEFARKYMGLLAAGGSKSAAELLQPFGLNLEDPAFWDGGMKTIEDMIDRLEAELKAVQARPAPRSQPQGPGVP